MAHFRRLEWHLQLLGVTLGQFSGSVMDLLAAEWTYFQAYPSQVSSSRTGAQGSAAASRQLSAHALA
jgi:hypothetical protein